MSILDHMRRWKAARMRHPPRDATADVIIRVLGRCPVCRSSFASHWYVPFAVMVMRRGSEGQIQKFAEAFTAHRWEEVREHQVFDPQEDAAEVFSLLCSKGSEAMLLFLDPEE
jgi:hypothetical protein